MSWRRDAGIVAAECILELERAASSAGGGVVGTVGHVAFEPGLINVVPGGATMSLDIRGTDDSSFLAVARHIGAFANEMAKRRGMTAEYMTHQMLPATLMDRGVVRALELAAASTGEPYKLMPSGAAHDTMCWQSTCPVLCSSSLARMASAILRRKTRALRTQHSLPRPCWQRSALCR
jgi:acetylornithine deacetylase/succinyl-diaminopimelate desuccinylase-like protein